MIFLAVIALVLAGYFVYTGIFKKEEETKYVMAAVEKSTIIVSVSGSGRISALDQVEIKPKVSGEIISFSVSKDQEVKKGQLLAVLDTKSAQRAVVESEIALEQAKEKLEELVSSPDSQSLIKAENALTQAELDFEKAQKTHDNIEADIEKNINTLNEEGYNDVSTSFFKLSGYMNDLKDALGTEQSELDYVKDYKLVLGENSLLIINFINDYYEAKDLFEESFGFFSTVSRYDDGDKIYQLISKTLEASKAIFRATESARHMYDAIVLNKDYKSFAIASNVDKMKSKIESNFSPVFSVVSSLQKTIETIDETIENIPSKIKDAELSFKLAQEKLEEKKSALDDLRVGVSSLDIKNQENVLSQKESVLATAKENLANCYIYAPFDGVIAELGNVKIGDSVGTGTTLATAITNKKIAELSFNEIDAAKIKVGQKATLVFDALQDITVVGGVAEIDTLGTVNQGVVSYGVKIVLDDEDERIKSGMSITADIIIDAKIDVLALPSNAVKSQSGDYYVELVEVLTDKAEEYLSAKMGVALPALPIRMSVQVGVSNDSLIEILSGLEEGDIVVSSTINSTQSAKTTQTQGTQQIQIPGMNAQMRTTR